MTREEAQHILELIRPDHDGDWDDPFVREALELLETDAELRAWHEATLTADRRISRSLGAIPVPADLKSSILAGMRMHATGHDEEPAEFPESETLIPRRSRIWWRQPWVAVAACLLLVFGVALDMNLSRSGQKLRAETASRAGIPDFVNFLSEQIPSFRGFDRTSRDAEELRSFLASQGDPTPQALPGKLNQAPSLGCVTFTRDGTKFSMICFKGEVVYHLITVNRSELAEPLPSAPQFFECNGQTFRVWTEGDQVLILSVKGSKEQFSEII